MELKSAQLFNSNAKNYITQHIRHCSAEQQAFILPPLLLVLLNYILNIIKFKLYIYLLDN